MRWCVASAAKKTQGESGSLSRQRDVAVHGTRSPGSPQPGPAQRSDEKCVVLLAGEMVMLCVVGFNTCLKWFKDGSRDELLFIKWELHRRPPFNGTG